MEKTKQNETEGVATCTFTQIIPKNNFYTYFHFEVKYSSFE